MERKVPPTGHKSRIVDTFLGFLTVLEKLYGIRYPGRPLQLSIDYYYPTLRKLAGEELKDALKMLVLGSVFNPSIHQNTHQYAVLLRYVCDAEETPELSEIVIRVAKTHYEILHLENTDVSLLEEFLKRKFKTS